MEPKAKLWRRAWIYVAVFVAILVIGVVLKSQEASLSKWIFYPALFLVIIAYATVRVLGKMNARKIRRCPPDFDPPMPPTVSNVDEAKVRLPKS